MKNSIQLDRKTNTLDTLPKFLLANYHRFGADYVATREKDMGIWQSYTWAEYYEIVRHLCLSFIDLGLKPGQKVAILAENKPHAYWFELAAFSAGAVVVGIFADCTPPEVEFYIAHSESVFVICQNQEQVDKVLEIKDKTPSLKKIIYWDEKGLWNYSDPILITMDEMLKIGKNRAKEHPTAFEDSIEKTSGENLAVFFFSSGTTGLPKAAMVTQQALIGMARAIDDVDHYQVHEEYLSFLPLAWIAEQLLGVACSMVYSMRTNFPEEPETVQENIREVGPQIVFFGPRLWENLIRMVQVKIQDSGWINRLFYKMALKIGYRMAACSMIGLKAGPGLTVLYKLADLMVFAPLRDNLGLSKTRIGYSAGAAVSPDVIKYFHAIGVNVKQLYGSSEIGVVTCHRDHAIKAESCGPAFKDVEIKLSKDGEVLIKTPNMFSGYYKEPEKTAECLIDGWYYTGDFGHLDKDDHLVVMDRMSDLMDIAGGIKFSPQYCEIRLRFSAYIKDVLVVARPDQKFVGALVNIDLDNVGQWAETHHIPFTTFTDLSQKSKVIELIRNEIKIVNEKLPEFSVIKKFINLHKEFDPDESELTRTRKLRRTFVEKKFKQLIDGLFSSVDQIEITSEITYRDGRVGKTQSKIKVNII